MATSIDRAWIKRELQSFNRFQTPYDSPDNNQRLTRLINAICFHLAIRKDKEASKAVAKYLEASMDEDGKTRANVFEIYDLLAQLRYGVGVANKVVDSLLSDS
jgi:hypothetical protein